MEGEGERRIRRQAREGDEEMGRGGSRRGRGGRGVDGQGERDRKGINVCTNAREISGCFSGCQVWLGWVESMLRMKIQRASYKPKVNPIQEQEKSIGEGCHFGPFHPQLWEYSQRPLVGGKTRT